jgi:hypothetical protein
MADTNDIGRFFWVLLKFDEAAPRYHVWGTYQTQPPYQASRTVFIRLWGSFGLALGWWEDNPHAETEDEVELMIRALSNGRGTGYDPSVGGKGEKVLHAVDAGT